MMQYFLNQEKLSELSPFEAKLTRSLILSIKSCENLNHMPILVKEKWDEILLANIRKEPEPT